MKFPKRRTIVRSIAVAVVAVMLLSGGACQSDTNATKSDGSEKIVDRFDNDLEGGKLFKTYEVDDGRLRLTTTYSTDYPVAKWQITSSKTLNFQLGVKPLKGGEGAQVYVEHVHVDVGLVSKRQTLNGMNQDSMDDSLHSGTDPGFVISNGWPYQGIFVIEGFSDTLISGWGYQTQSWGESEVTQERLTEGALYEEGVTGSKFSFVYDLMIRYPGETGFHKVAVRSEFIVPSSRFQK